MADSIIKTTARFQEAGEPVKQRPIIQVEQADGRLPNTVRASMDSGRDNPFRPDGKIYRSADPIVDYYKHGANQSRAQSPTDSQLLLNGTDPSASEQKNKKQKQAKKKKKKEKDKHRQEGEETEKQRESCWRRWCCCCCRVCSCFGALRCCRRSTDANGEQEEKNDENDITRLESVRSEPTTKQPTAKTVVLREETSEGATETTNTREELNKSSGRCSVS